MLRKSRKGDAVSEDSRGAVPRLSSFPKTSRSSFFTLLEIMIAFVLVTIVGGAIGWKMHGAVAKKKFVSQVERVQDRFAAAQKLAVAMQADWRGVLKKEGKGWVFDIVCEEGGRSFAPLRFDSMGLLFEGKEVDEVVFDFFSSGQVQPQGSWVFTHPSGKVEWNQPKTTSRG